MLFFGPVLYPLLCITSLYNSSSSSFMPSYTSFSLPLLHVPSKLGCYYHCILIYTWIYNIYHYYISSINSSSYTSLHTKIQQQLFFIYLRTNFTIAFGVRQDILPIHSLGLLPLIICGSFYQNSIDYYDSLVFYYHYHIYQL
jgi:hypothetical protein